MKENKKEAQILQTFLLFLKAAMCHPIRRRSFKKHIWGYYIPLRLPPSFLYNLLGSNGGAAAVVITGRCRQGTFFHGSHKALFEANKRVIFLICMCVFENVGRKTLQFTLFSMWCASKIRGHVRSIGRRCAMHSSGLGGHSHTI